MPMSTAFSRTFGCSSCRQWMLRSFIANIGGQPVQSTAHLRPISQSAARRVDYDTRTARTADSALQELNDVLSSTAQPQLHAEQQSAAQALPQKPPEPATCDYLPWYLQPQHQPSPNLTSPLSSRQSIPLLPEYSPSLLEPTLQYVSVDLGMDDLTLLDLRRLDPPPALGANLLMVVCTARSEKHLHVSADRLCRWLRATHKLSPYADGLLGRNELKLKLRRRAKRSRLLSAVGAKAASTTEDEDGLRTGWVCINFGRVQGGELPIDVKSVQRAEGMVGFGAKIEGCSIVVQMLTQEKREEIDLEKLWTGILQRALRGEGNDQTISHAEAPYSLGETRIAGTWEGLDDVALSRTIHSEDRLTVL